MSVETRYHYTIEGNVITCESTYAGKPVRGYAKCSIEDVFNEDIGKEIARARVDAKIAKLRYKRSGRKLEEAYFKSVEADKYIDKMVKYKTDAFSELMTAESNLIDINKKYGRHNNLEN